MEEMKFSRQLSNRDVENLELLFDADKSIEDRSLSFQTSDEYDSAAIELEEVANKSIESLFSELGVEYNPAMFQEVPEINLTDPKEDLTQYGYSNSITGNIVVHQEVTKKESFKDQMTRIVARTISKGHADDGYYTLFKNSVPEFSDKDLAKKREHITAVHELLHYKSTRFRYSSINAKKGDYRFIYKSGIQTTVKEGEGSQKIFNLLNEGITDYFAIKAVDMNQKAKDLIIKNKKQAYSNNRDLFSVMVAHMAKKESLDTDIVLRDWMQVYLDGWTPEFKRRLRETFGDNILKELAYLKIEDISEFVRNLRELTEIGKGSQTLRQLLKEAK